MACCSTWCGKASALGHGSVVTKSQRLDGAKGACVAWVVSCPKAPHLALWPERMNRVWIEQYVVAGLVRRGGARRLEARPGALCPPHACVRRLATLMVDVVTNDGIRDVWPQGFRCGTCGELSYAYFVAAPPASSWPAIGISATGRGSYVRSWPCPRS